MPELNVSRVGVLGRRKGPVPAVPPAGALHKADRSHYVACCGWAALLVRSLLILQRGPAPPSTVYNSLKFPTLQVLL